MVKKKVFMPNVNQPRFVVVDMNEITRRSYFERMELEEVESGLEIFEKKNIPRKFQKLIIYVKPLFKFTRPYDYYEYTLGFPFYLNIINENDNKEKKYLEGQNNCVRTYENLNMYNRINFKTEFRVYSKEAIDNFFKEMYDSGYLGLYLECIKEIFWKISFVEIVDRLGNETKKDEKVKTREKKIK